jgi:hypothetical protein
MDTATLIQRISKPISKQEADSLAQVNAQSAGELIKLSLLADYELAFRAAWILEQVAFLYDQEFHKLIPDFAAAYIKLENKSCQRHYTKMMMHLSVPAHIDHHLGGVDLDPIVETTFEWLIDADTPVAVRVNCMDILYNLRKKYDWIAGELEEQIRFQMREGSAALQSRGKRVLQRLSRSKRD